MKYLRLWVKGSDINDRVWNEEGFVPIVTTNSQEIFIKNVRKGRNRLVVAQGYDSNQQPIPGFILSAIYNSPEKERVVTVRLTWRTFPAGQILERLLTQNPQLAASVDFTQLQQLLDQLLYGNTTNTEKQPYVTHPSRINLDAIVANLTQNKGQLPPVTALPADWRAKDSQTTIVVRNPGNTAFNSPIQITVDDPASQAFTIPAGQDQSPLGNPASGQWTLNAKLAGLNGGVKAQVPVNVAPDGTVTLNAATTATPLLLPPVITAINSLALVPSVGLRGWWQADGVTDDTANFNHGMLVNGAAYTAGNNGQAFVFDGIDDYVQIGNRRSLEFSNAFTASFWVKPAVLHDGIIVNKEGEYEFNIFSNGNFRYALANTNPGWTWIDTGLNAPINQWTHFVIAYDNGQITVYRNGTQGHTFAGSGALGDVHPQWQDLRIGGRQGTIQFFNGAIDGVQLYNRPLSAAEILRLYQNPVNAIYGQYTLNLTGDGFQGVLANNSMTCGGLPGQITATSSTSVNALLSSDAVGEQPLAVTTLTKTSNQPVIAIPTLTHRISRPMARPGDTVKITGQQFAPTANTVTFNGIQATPSTMGLSQLTVTVPAGATAANIQVQNSYGTSVGPLFMPVPNNLISWWQAEGTANDSQSSYHGTLTNGATATPIGQIDKAFGFDGVNDYIQVGTPAGLDLGASSFSVAFWMSSPLTSPNQGLLWKGVGPFNAGGQGWEFRTQGTMMEFIRARGELPARLQALGLPAEKPIFVVGTVDLTNNQGKLYIDGVLKATQTYSGNYTDTYALQMGRGNDGYYQGWLDEVMIFNRTLSATEIQTMYDATR